MIHRALFIIAFKDFRDQEYFIPLGILRRSGFSVDTASWQKGRAMGIEGNDVNVDWLLDDIDVSRYDAIIFIGGMGATKFIGDLQAHRIAQHAQACKKVLAAICIAPTILAEAGILKGVNATVWSSNMDKSAVKILQKSGAKYIDQKLVRDGNIITANGVLAAKVFGQEIMQAVLDNKH